MEFTSRVPFPIHWTVKSLHFDDPNRFSPSKRQLVIGAIASVWYKMTFETFLLNQIDNHPVDNLLHFTSVADTFHVQRPCCYPVNNTDLLNESWHEIKFWSKNSQYDNRCNVNGETFAIWKAQQMWVKFEIDRWRFPRSSFVIGYLAGSAILF